MVPVADVQPFGGMDFQSDALGYFSKAAIGGGPTVERDFALVYSQMLQVSVEPSMVKRQVYLYHAMDRTKDSVGGNPYTDEHFYKNCDFNFWYKGVLQKSYRITVRGSVTLLNTVTITTYVVNQYSYLGKFNQFVNLPPEDAHYGPSVTFINEQPSASYNFECRMTPVLNWVSYTFDKTTSAYSTYPSLFVTAIPFIGNFYHKADQITAVLRSVDSDIAYPSGTVADSRGNFCRYRNPAQALVVMSYNASN